MSPFNQPPPESIADGVMTWHEHHVAHAARVPGCDECAAQALTDAIADAPDAPVCLGCGAPTDGAETHPGCTYDASPATPEERERIARITAPTLLDALRAQSKRWRDTALVLRRAHEIGCAHGYESCASHLDAILAAHTGDDRGESDGAEVGR